MAINLLIISPIFSFGTDISQHQNVKNRINYYYILRNQTAREAIIHNDMDSSVFASNQPVKSEVFAYVYPTIMSDLYVSVRGNAPSVEIKTA